jgi:folate-binding protein YgfZ
VYDIYPCDVFAPSVEEYERAERSAVRVELGTRALFEVSGPDATELLQGQVTNDVAALAPGTGCYALLLTHKARVRADMRIVRLDDRDGAPLYLVESESFARPVLAHMLTTAAVGLRARFRDLGERFQLIALVGPHSDRFVATPPAAREHAVSAADGGFALRTYLGIDLLVPAGQAAVAPGDELRNGSRALLECLRVEHGRARLGIELGSTVMPAEAGVVERAVSFTKGCYVGQEPVARLHYRGRPNRLLRGLRLSGEAAPGATLVREGREVGKVGTCVRSPRFGTIALALVRREVEPHERVAVLPPPATDEEGSGRRSAGAPTSDKAQADERPQVHAEVVALPFRGDADGASSAGVAGAREGD